MKKILAIALTLVLVSTAISTSFAQEETRQFKDVGPNHWAYEIINEMVEQGVINGHPDGTFRPNDPVQVDQFLKMILMVLSEDKADGSRYWKDDFLDRSDAYTVHELIHGSPGFDFTPGEKNWADPYIEQAQNMGLFGRYNRWNGKFNSSLVREDVAYLLMKTITMFEEEEETNYAMLAETQIKDLQKITDSEDRHHVRQVYMKGLMRGYQDGNFGVGRVVTRAEAVTMLNRILDSNKRDPYLPDLSYYPHAEVPTRNGGIKSIVFPNEHMKKSFDLMLENRDQSPGFTDYATSRVSMIYYENEEQHIKELERAKTLNGAFKSPIMDIQLRYGTGHDKYELSINTADNIWDRHSLAIIPMLHNVLGEDTEKFIQKIEELLPKAKKGELLTLNFTFNDRFVSFQGSGSNQFLYIYF